MVRAGILQCLLLHLSCQACPNVPPIPSLPRASLNPGCLCSPLPAPRQDDTTDTHACIGYSDTEALVAFRGTQTLQVRAMAHWSSVGRLRRSRSRAAAARVQAAALLLHPVPASPPAHPPSTERAHGCQGVAGPAAAAAQARGQGAQGAWSSCSEAPVEAACAHCLCAACCLAALLPTTPPAPALVCRRTPAF